MRWVELFLLKVLFLTEEMDCSAEIVKGESGGCAEKVFPVGKQTH